MDSLHILDGIDHGGAITIAHLLQHTSGLPDYFSNQTLDGSPSIFDLIIAEPNHLWQPEEMIAFAKAHFQPNFAPGTAYQYTDTEYVLLGIIIEQLSGLALHDFFAQHIFIPLKMSHTHLHLRSEPEQTTLRMAELYASHHELSSWNSLSADWAGGAIVATGKDLITFQSALMKGKLVSQTTLEAMQEWTDESWGMYYGYGLRKIELNALDADLPELVAVGHSGANGSLMFYCPDLDLYLAGTLNQLEASKEAVLLMAKVLSYCLELE